jgi:hypothetical protein
MSGFNQTEISLRGVVVHSLSRISAIKQRVAGISHLQ